MKIQLFSLLFREGAGGAGAAVVLATGVPVLFTAGSQQWLGANMGFS